MCPVNEGLPEWNRCSGRFVFGAVLCQAESPFVNNDLSQNTVSSAGILGTNLTEPVKSSQNQSHFHSNNFVQFV